ncbi:hypothetical protein CELD12_26460 [Cellulomonas sp. NTE-D12]|nr:hypothetical protein CELD12_26460 [Cellulomonas sp. NTE-D12]
MPDSNIWRYLVDEDAIEAVRMEAKRRRVAIVACPAVVYEALRDPDANRRHRLLRAMTLGSWTRLMSESYTEANELRAEIVRLRPAWLEPQPDLQDWYRLQADWKGGFWRRGRHDTRAEAARVTLLEARRNDTAREERRRERQQARERGWDIANVPLDLTDSFTIPVPGWDGEPFQAWRSVGLNRYWVSLLAGKGADWDWLSPWLAVPLVLADQASWVAMWLYETDASHVPHQWLRWAFDLVQSTQRINDGTVFDNQIANYLPHCDAFITSDTRFVRQIEKVRPHSPIELAQAVLAPSGSAAVEATMCAIANLSEG